MSATQVHPSEIILAIDHTLIKEEPSIDIKEEIIVGSFFEEDLRSENNSEAIPGTSKSLSVREQAKEYVYCICKEQRYELFMELCIICDKETSPENRKSNKTCQTCKTDLWYACLLCEVSPFSSLTLMSNHLIKLHEVDTKTPCICSRCKKQFMMKQYFEHCLKSNVAEPKIQCHFCNVKFTSTDALLIHLRYDHSALVRAYDTEQFILINCEITKEVLDHREKIQLLKGKLDANLTAKLSLFKLAVMHCKKCNGNFIITETNPVPFFCKTCSCKLLFECTICHENYETQSLFFAHLKADCLTKPTHCCKICNYKTPYKHQLKKHFDTSHRALQCSICEKWFSEASFCKFHENICKIFHCDYCKFSSHSKFYLKKHILYHMKKFEIKEKSKRRGKDKKKKTTSFKDLDFSLHNKHQFVIERSMAAYCSSCRRRTKPIKQISKCQTCDVALHYRCRVCKFSNPSYSRVSYHVINQHKEKMYYCQTCKQTFLYQNLLNHMDQCRFFLHCPRCSFYTKFEKNLKNHMLQGICKAAKNSKIQKLEVKPQKDEMFNCDHCSFKTNVKATLESHIQSKHGARLFRGIDFNCEKCLKIFKSYFLYSKHSESCKSKKTASFSRGK